MLCVYFIRIKSKEMKMAKSGEICELPVPLQASHSPRSYAQVLSPTQHGVKRTTSDRFCVSPIDCCPKRSARFQKEVSTSIIDYTPPNQKVLHDRNTPEGTLSDFEDRYSKENNGSVQRRLFSSPGQCSEGPITNRYFSFLPPASDWFQSQKGSLLAMYLYW